MTTSLFFIFGFCSKTDNLWNEFFPGDNEVPKSIQNKKNPKIPTSKDRIFINHSIFISLKRTPVNIDGSRENNLKFLDVYSIFQNNYIREGSVATNIDIRSNVDFFEYRTTVLNCGTIYKGQHINLMNGNTNCSILDSLYHKLGFPTFEGIYECGFHLKINTCKISNINMTDANGIKAAGCYIKVNSGSILVNYSIFCLLRSYKDAVIGFDSSTNLSYCNIFNNTAGDCKYGILSFYSTQSLQIYIDNCAIFNNGCYDYTLEGTSAKNISIYVTNSFIDNCKVSGGASLTTSNVTNISYQYNLSLEIPSIFEFSDLGMR